VRTGGLVGKAKQLAEKYRGNNKEEDVGEFKDIQDFSKKLDELSEENRKKIEALEEELTERECFQNRLNAASDQDEESVDQEDEDVEEDVEEDEEQDEGEGDEEQDEPPKSGRRR
jgi:hypothetical protein